MKKKIISLILSAVAALSVMPVAAVKAYDACDYYARNFIATENGVFWEGCEQISWFNPAVEATKISLYAKGPNQKDGSYVMLGDDYDTTPNASVVTTLPTKNWAVTPRNSNYTFKLVAEFDDGQETELYYDAKVPNDSNGNTWFFTTELSDDFKSIASRGGWCYSQSGKNTGYDIPPIASEVVYEDGDPALKIWSNTHIAESTDETRDGVTNNSGNYYADVKLIGASEIGTSYDISFRYKAKGIENLVLYINNKDKSANKQTVTIEDTDGEWENFSTTVVSETTNNLIDFHFQCGNEALILDDVVVKKTGTEDNLLSDGDFSILAASSPDIPEEAAVTNKDDNVIVSWKDITDGVGVNIYEVVGKTEIKRAFVKKGTTNATFKGDLTSKYVVKAVNAKGAESAGATCELPSFSDYEIAVIDPNAFVTGRSGEMVISWQNSNCAAITRVRVEDENGTIVADSDNPPSEDDNPNKDMISTKAGDLCRYTLTSYKNNEYHSFKIITETDFGSIVQTVTGNPEVKEYTSKLVDVTEKMHMNVLRGNESTAFSDIWYEVENENGNHSLKVVNHYLKTWMPSNTYVDFGKKKGELDLKPNTKYKLEFKYKGYLYAWQKVFVHDQSGTSYGTVDISSTTTNVTNWSTFTKTVTTDGNADSRGFVFYFGCGSGGPMWIDDIRLTEVDTNNVIYSENFESGVVTYDAALTDVSVTAADESAVIKWTAPEDSDDVKDLVKIFAEHEGNKYLAAIVEPSLGEYTVTGLSNESDYKFTVQLVDSNGHTAEAKTASATPEAPACKIKNVVLCDKYGDKTEQDSLSAGEYKVSADVKNNGMGNSFTAQLIVCLYDGDTLYEAKASKVTSISQTAWKNDPETLLTDTFTVPSLEGHNFTLKAYIWDSLTGMNKLESVTLFK